MIFHRSARPTRQDQTREWARCVVRSGLLSADEVLAELTAVIAADLPEIVDAPAEASRWFEEERAAWIRDACAWPRPTDFDRIHAAFTELRQRGYLVLEGCLDHWAAQDALAVSPNVPGVLWFVPADVWHAIDEPMLEINLWHPSTSNASAADELTHEVLGVLSEYDLLATFDEGRIEVAARWNRNPEN
ncbi:MAG TPA: hypothetical protein VN108_04705 [Marmoricola sp.]|nr:hypothetical protein [Marmoricola sp.]